MANNQKIENILNMALEVSPQERLRSMNLETGYDPAFDTWSVIVRFTGDFAAIQEQFPQISTTLLSNQYGILEIPESLIDDVANLPQIIYMEKPKRLFFASFQARQAACITSVQAPYGSVSAPDAPGSYALSGKGVLVGIIDSGIDYTHPDFRNADGSTRILRLWDQTLGQIYTAEQINEALAQDTQAERLAICPSRDLSGHGTHVAGIAAGNGRASDGVYRGVAFDSELLIVKLGIPDPEGFPSTIELMKAVDYCIYEAGTLGRPLALNLSFGNSYGSHSGTSLIESYLNDMASLGQLCICVGSGNEGAASGHTGGFLDASASTTIEFAVSAYETSLNIQLWKNYADEFRITLNAPSGDRSIAIDPLPGTMRYRIGDCDLLVYYGEPVPYSRYQEIYFDFIPAGDYLEEGIWSMTFTPQRIVTGIWDMWMPSASIRSLTTRFLTPTPYTTLTIPSTAAKVISVGAYNSYYNSISAFSGRGYTWDTQQVKPDLAAPGVEINSCAPGGGYTVKSGTSMATPFVTGSTALLMEYGIIQGNDPFLYGEKVKAYLIQGAARIPALTTYPNPELGWGTLCLKNSFPT